MLEPQHGRSDSSLLGEPEGPQDACIYVRMKAKQGPVAVAALVDCHSLVITNPAPEPSPPLGPIALAELTDPALLLRPTYTSVSVCQCYLLRVKMPIRNGPAQPAQSSLVEQARLTRTVALPSQEGGW